MALETDLINYFNQSGGIPLKIVSETSWSQYTISLVIGLIGSFFIFFYIYTIFKPQIITLYMKIKIRKLLKQTQRDIIVVKHSQSSLFNSSMIDQQTTLDMTSALAKIKGRPVDIVLHTPGGDVFSSMYLSKLLKAYPSDVRFIIPIYAMSGGTLLSLSGSKILMLPTSTLGPVDIQLGSLFKFGSANSWDHIVKYKGKKAEDSSISFALMGKQYTQSMRNHLDFILQDHIINNKKRKDFIDLVTSGKIEHSHLLTPTLLKKFGLNIEVVNYKIMEPLLEIITSKGFEGVHLIKK